MQLPTKSVNSATLSFLHIPTLTSIHDYWKTIALNRQTLVGKVMSLLFNMLSRLVISFLPRSKRLVISWLQSTTAVILEPPKIKFDTVSTVSSSVSHEVMGTSAMILVFWILSFKPTFSLSFTFTKRHRLGHSLELLWYWMVCLEMNRDHSVIFEIASKYCILDSFVDHDGYSISS